MLVLTRKLQQQIKIGDQITVTILRVKGQTVRVGIEAPRDVRVIRGELPARTDDAAATESQTQEAELVVVGEEDDAATAEDAVAPRVSSVPALSVVASGKHLPQRKAANRYAVPPLRLAMTGAAGTLAK